MRQVMLTGQPANWAADKEGKDWATSMEDDIFAESFTAGMNSRGAYLAQGLSKAIDFQEYKNILVKFQHKKYITYSEEGFPQFNPVFKMSVSIRCCGMPTDFLPNFIFIACL